MSFLRLELTTEGRVEDWSNGERNNSYFPYIVFIQKRGILAKVKEREGCKHRNTLNYFEDYNLKRDAACPAIALTLPKGRRRKIDQNGRLWMNTT